MKPLVGDTVTVVMPPENMWPSGVKSLEDMQRFSRMFLGDQVIEDYGDRMPETRPDCWLFVCRGGCKEGTPLAELADCVTGIMEDVEQDARDRNNWSTPESAYQTGASNGDSWYDSAQLSRRYCICKLNFGGEGSGRTRKNLSPDCQKYPSGIKFESVLMAALKKNSELPDVGANNYLDKAFHALLNRNRHQEQHRIGWHSDKFPGSYVNEDPITSLSWQATGVLLMAQKPKKGQVPTSGSDIKVLVSLHGDVYIAGGMFQECFVHSVPPVGEWPAILQQHRHYLRAIEIEAMETEIRYAAEKNGRIRRNITVRWHNNHKNCSSTWKRWSPGAVPQQSVAQLAQQIELTKASHPHGIFKLGTQAPVLPQSAAVSRPGLATPSGAAPGPALTLEHVCVAVQTEESQSQLVVLRKALSDYCQIVAENFSSLDIVPAALAVCSFAGSQQQWTVEKQCVNKFAKFLESLDANLVRFDRLLQQIDTEGRKEYDALINKASRMIHLLQSVVYDRYCLRRAMDDLLVHGCEFYEITADKSDVQIRNAKWLLKLILTHADCESLMETIDTNLLQRYGDIVWQMPRDWKFVHVDADSRQVDYLVRRSHKLYINFFDVGPHSDAATHRLHLRVAHPETLAGTDAEAFKLRVRDAICRCNSHVRVMDVDGKAFDTEASTAMGSYRLAVWAGPWKSRERFYEKAAEQKFAQQKRSGADWSSSDWSSYGSWQGNPKSGRPWHW